MRVGRARVKKIELIQRRAVRFTIGRYKRTSSVNAMLTYPKWERRFGRLASIRRSARLLMFCKIHYGRCRPNKIEINSRLEPLLLSSANDLAVSGYKHQ